MKAIALIAGILGASSLLAADASGVVPGEGDSSPNVVVTVTGTGMGLVTDPGAFPPITCPGNCSGTHAINTDATLTASEAPGSVFQGFTGVNCVGAGNPCQFNVGVTANQVTAVFNESTDTDTDGDGVPNAADGCPSAPGPAALQGCPDPGPPPSGGKCERAKVKLKRLKVKLAALKQDDVSDKKIDSAERRVRKAAKAKRRACA